MSLKNTLKKLEAKSDKVIVETATGDEVELTLRGLTFPELTRVSEFADKDDGIGASNYILECAVRGAYEISGEEFTEEDVKSSTSLLNGKSASKIIRSVKELSGLDEMADEADEGGASKND